MEMQEAVQEVDLDVEITDEKIERAAVPKHRRVEDDVQDQNIEIDIDESSSNSTPVTDDEIKENFEVSPKVEEKSKDLSDVEKRASLAQNRINKAVGPSQRVSRRELMAVQYARDLKDQKRKLRQSQRSFQAVMAMSLTVVLNLKLH
jgi:hypothetical protein